MPSKNIKRSLLRKFATHHKNTGPMVHNERNRGIHHNKLSDFNANHNLVDYSSSATAVSNPLNPDTIHVEPVKNAIEVEPLVLRK